MRICKYISAASRVLFPFKARTVAPSASADRAAPSYVALKNPVPAMILTKGSLLGALDLTKRQNALSLLFVFHIPTNTLLISEAHSFHKDLATAIFPGINIDPEDKTNIVGGVLTIKGSPKAPFEITADPRSAHFYSNRDVRPLYKHLAKLATSCKFASTTQLDGVGAPTSMKIFA